MKNSNNPYSRAFRENISADINPSSGLMASTVSLAEDQLPLEQEHSEAIYRRALKTYGADAQITITFEEMAELQKELCKHARGADNKAHIAEEIADCLIMLEQMQLLFDIRNDVSRFTAAKLARLEERLDERDS